jgi:hypothetical protein
VASRTSCAWETTCTSSFASYDWFDVSSAERKCSTTGNLESQDPPAKPSTSSLTRWWSQLHDRQPW